MYIKLVMHSHTPQVSTGTQHFRWIVDVNQHRTQAKVWSQHCKFALFACRLTGNEDLGKFCLIRGTLYDVLDSIVSWQYEQTICAMLLGKPCTIASTSLTALGYSPADAFTTFLDETLSVSKTRWWSQLITACELVKDDCPSMTWSCSQLISLWEGSRYCTLLGTGWGEGREVLSTGFDLVIRTVECPTTVTPSSLDGRAFGAGTVELDAAAVEDDASRRGPLRNLSGRFGTDCPLSLSFSLQLLNVLGSSSPNAFPRSPQHRITKWIGVLSFLLRFTSMDRDCVVCGSTLNVRQIFWD